MRIAREMLWQFPNVAGFHSIADAKLFVYEEHPETVARHIAAFLREPSHLGSRTDASV